MENGPVHCLFTRQNYWAANLPVNRGRFNLDTIRYDYYLDDNVAFEAFKAGAFDLRLENDAKNWATRYIGKISIIITSLKKSRKTSRRRTHAGWPLIFSARYLKTGGYVKLSPLAFDFEWMNKALFYNARSRTNSYFQNTEYAARNYPDADELVLLAPMKRSSS